MQCLLPGVEFSYEDMGWVIGLVWFPAFALVKLAKFTALLITFASDSLHPECLENLPQGTSIR